jgi:hypothetical protein
MDKEFKRTVIACMCGFVAILVFITTTNPSSLYVPLLLLLPLIVAITFYSLCSLLLRVFTHLQETKIKTISLISSLAPTLLILLGSLNQLSSQDFLLAILLVVGLCWYIKRVQAIRI